MLDARTSSLACEGFPRALGRHEPSTNERPRTRLIFLAPSRTLASGGAVWLYDERDLFQDVWSPPGSETPLRQGSSLNQASSGARLHKLDFNSCQIEAAFCHGSIQG